VSDRQSCPEPSGAQPAEATAWKDHDECRTDSSGASSAGTGDGQGDGGYRLGQRGPRLAVVDEQGRAVDRFSVAHTGPGLRRLVARLRQRGVTEVAIERPDVPVVDALLEAELTVFVIDPKQVKNMRGRYGSAGNKDDRFDAYVLADVMRTDRARMRPLTRDSEQTISMRMTVRARQDLVHARVAMGNQLRAHLQITLPGAIKLFRDIDSAITLAFLRRFPSQDKADWLSRLAWRRTSIPGARPATSRS
jgi:transposase